MLSHPPKIKSKSEFVLPPALPNGERHLPMSLEAFWVWEDGCNEQAEWVNGEVIIFMPPKTIHQEIVGFLHWLLLGYVDLFKLGKVILSPFGMLARPEGPAREPDLLFVTQAHLARLTPEKLEGPADLVIEVVSESSILRDYEDKFIEYQAVGVQEYWIIDPLPQKKQVSGFTLNAAGVYESILPDAQGHYHSLLLPGFWFDETWLWQTPLPSPLLILREIAPSAF